MSHIFANPSRLIFISFLFLIILGSFFLYLPSGLITEQQISYIDALFTSASASCVTGLTVLDTGEFFSIYGKITILFLFQIGGLGIMTFSTLILFIIRGRFGIRSREIIQESLSSFYVTDIYKLLKYIIIFTFSIESIGALLLYIRFSFDMPFNQALFNAIFHSVSAFCNAGFSTFSSSLIVYKTDILVNLVIITLIVSGGLGFIVIFELFQKRGSIILVKHYSLHTKIVLTSTLGLILLGTILIFIFEFNGSLKSESLYSKLLISLFQSVTSRTAGFNTLNINLLSLPTIFVLISLMFIGASPSSTGGGIKTTTFVLIISYIISRIKEQKNVNLFYRTFNNSDVSKSIVVFVFGILTISFFTILVTLIELGSNSTIENGNQFLSIIFEVVSAFGTVGLSTGITPSLSEASKVLLSILMLIGRVGPLTLVLAIGSKKTDIKYASENVSIG